MSEENINAFRVSRSSEESIGKGAKSKPLEKKKRKVRLKKEVKSFLAIVSSFIIVMVLYITYDELTKFEYEKELDTIVVTVGNTNINLKELTYYIMLVERTGNEYARQYDENNLTEYWGLYMNQGEETGYVTDLAKKAALDYCIRDNIYAMEAGVAGITLNQVEETELKADAENAYLAMSSRELEVSGLSQEELKLIMEKELLAHKYMSILAQNYEEGALEAITLVYDVGGSYYNELLEKYPVSLNNKLWKNVKVGYVTIN